MARHRCLVAAGAATARKHTRAHGDVMHCDGCLQEPLYGDAGLPNTNYQLAYGHLAIFLHLTYIIDVLHQHNQERNPHEIKYFLISHIRQYLTKSIEEHVQFFTFQLCLLFEIMTFIYIYIYFQRQVFFSHLHPALSWAS